MAQNLEGAQAAFKIYRRTMKRDFERNLGTIPSRREMYQVINALTDRCEELAKHTVKLERRVTDLEVLLAEKEV